jgi:hypothetical protein
MVTKLSRASGEVEYGLPVWLFFEFLIFSVVFAFCAPSISVSRPAAGSGIFDAGSGCADL